MKALVLCCTSGHGHLLSLCSWAVQGGHSLEKAAWCRRCHGGLSVLWSGTQAGGGNCLQSGVERMRRWWAPSVLSRNLEACSWDCFERYKRARNFLKWWSPWKCISNIKVSTACLVHGSYWKKRIAAYEINLFYFQFIFCGKSSGQSFYYLGSYLWNTIIHSREEIDLASIADERIKINSSIWYSCTLVPAEMVPVCPRKLAFVSLGRGK